MITEGKDYYFNHKNCNSGETHGIKRSELTRNINTQFKLLSDIDHPFDFDSVTKNKDFMAYFQKIQGETDLLKKKIMIHRLKDAVFELLS